jgi:hypothetical protein
LEKLLQYRLTGENTLGYDKQYFYETNTSLGCEKDAFCQSLNDMFVDLLELLAMTFTPWTGHADDWC